MASSEGLSMLVPDNDRHVEDTQGHREANLAYDWMRQMGNHFHGDANFAVDVADELYQVRGMNHHNNVTTRVMTRDAWRAHTNRRKEEQRLEALKKSTDDMWQIGLQKAEEDAAAVTLAKTFLETAREDFGWARKALEDKEEAVYLDRVALQEAETEVDDADDSLVACRRTNLSARCLVIVVSNTWYPT